MSFFHMGKKSHLPKRNVEKIRRKKQFHIIEISCWFKFVKNVIRFSLSASVQCDKIRVLNKIHEKFTKKIPLSLLQIPFWQHEFLVRFISPRCVLRFSFVLLIASFGAVYNVSFRLWSINNANDGGRWKWENTHIDIC